MSDQLYDGRRIRLLTIVDNHTRESLAVHVSQRIRGAEVVRVLERISDAHGLPKTIQVDNGPEFISKDLDLWAYWNTVKLDFSRPGKPTDNALVDRVIQRPVPAGVPQRALVPDAGGRREEDRSLASGLQRAATAQQPGERAPGEVRAPAYSSGLGCASASGIRRSNMTNET